jgi:hypothetical protein
MRALLKSLPKAINKYPNGCGPSEKRLRDLQHTTRYCTTETRIEYCTNKPSREIDVCRRNSGEHVDSDSSNFAIFLLVLTSASFILFVVYFTTFFRN